MEEFCPKKSLKIKRMLKNGTFLCYITHKMCMQCSDVACCEDCSKKQRCPKVCKGVKIVEKASRYIQ